MPPSHSLLNDDPAVAAATRALSECDHARLPAWMVARIAVESARDMLRAELAVSTAAAVRPAVR